MLRNSPKILITESETLPKDIENRLKLSGLTADLIYSVEECHHPEQYEIVFGALIVKKLGLEAFPNLKWIHIATAGINHLPIQEWKEKGILLTNAKHVFSDPIAEYVVFYTLMHYKKGIEHLRIQENKEFRRLANRELTDQVVTIFGTGSLAQAIAKRFKPFNVKLIGINTTGNAHPDFDKVFSIAEGKAVLAISDVVVMTLPLTDATRYFYDESWFSAMKQDSILINVGRGRVLDEQALIRHLESSHLAMAVLDVMETEPLDSSHPLWTTPNCILTPHDSGVSEQTGQRLWELFLRNVKAYKDASDLENKV